MAEFFDFERNTNIPANNTMIDRDRLYRNSIGQNKKVERQNKKVKHNDGQKLVAGILAALTLGTGALLTPKMVTKGKNNQIYNKYQRAVELVVANCGNRTAPDLNVSGNRGYYYYDNNRIAEFLATQHDLTPADYAFLIYSSYGFNSEKNINEMLRSLNTLNKYNPTEYSEALQGITSLDELIKKCGYDSQEDFEKSMKERIVRDAKNDAIKNYTNGAEGLIIYDMENNTFTINENYELSRGETK